MYSLKEIYECVKERYDRDNGCCDNREEAVRRLDRLLLSEPQEHTFTETAGFYGRPQYAYNK